MRDPRPGTGNLEKRAGLPADADADGKAAAETELARVERRLSLTAAHLPDMVHRSELSTEPQLDDARPLRT